MLKPTERPPPSRAAIRRLHRAGTASRHDREPACANSRAVSRAASYVGDPSTTRAEPKIDTAGRSIRSTAWKPARNSDAMSATSLANDVSCVCRREASVELGRLAHKRFCGTWETTMPRTSAATVTSEVTATPGERRACVGVAARRRRAARATSGGRDRRRGSRSAGG